MTIITLFSKKVKRNVPCVFERLMLISNLERTKMPDENNPAPTSTAPINPPIVDSTGPQTNDPIMMNPATQAVPEVPSTPFQGGPSSNILVEVARKIDESHYVLIALSSDPSVDEMSSAIGISLFLDKLGKRATAIYSGSTPNALEFLKPEETFEPTVDSLQDFVVALNKEKAEHVRCKVDGDYVKVYITPYRDRIAEEDLEFSYGDFNVDLVLALDVANGIDLDSALREHGRIMHDATIINITTGNPGKLGEIEWSDKTASSVSEMIAKLLFSINSEVKVEKEEATAFLTGIVAATNRFSNAKTTPETMRISSKLMEAGANQQLVSKNITPDIENELFNMSNTGKKATDDPTKLDIKHGEGEDIDETKQVSTSVTEKESTLLDDLKAAEASLAQTGAETTPDLSNQPVKIEGDSFITPDLNPEPTLNTNPESSAEAPELAPSFNHESELETNLNQGNAPDLPSDSEPKLPEVKEDAILNPTEPIEQKEDEKVVQPSEEAKNEIPKDEGANKYGQMLEDALENPASQNTPATPTNPEINGVPEINYMPMPGEEILPPPPTPPIDMSGEMTPENPITPPTDSNPSTPTPTESSVTPTDPISMPAVAPISPAETQVAPTNSQTTSNSLPNVVPITPASPTPEPTPGPLGPQPAMQDQVYTPQATDPGTFKIPGM